MNEWIKIRIARPGDSTAAKTHKSAPGLKAQLEHEWQETGEAIIIVAVFEPKSIGTVPQTGIPELAQ